MPTDEDDRDEPALRKRRIRRAQKLQFLDHLIRNLDMVIYCQISILYYMEYVESLLPLPFCHFEPSTNTLSNRANLSFFSPSASLSLRSSFASSSTTSC